MSGLVIPRVGDLAYIDSLRSGMVPCNVVGINALVSPARWS